MSQWSQPWFTCSQISPTTCACEGNLIKISPIQTGFQARILPFRIISPVVFNRDGHTGKTRYIETALPQAVRYLLAFSCLFFFKQGWSSFAVLLMSFQHLHLMQKPPLHQEALPYNSCPAILLTHRSPCVKSSAKPQALAWADRPLLTLLLCAVSTESS